MIYIDKPVTAFSLTDGYSLEVSARAVPILAANAAGIPRGSMVSVPWLPGESNDARLAAIRAIRELGFQPMPHLAARRIASRVELDAFIQRAVVEGGIERCFVIAGDPATPKGPFADSYSLIETGVFERAGIKVVGVGGHPDGHSIMSEAERWDVLESKCQAIVSRGMAPLIITQFAFDADLVLAWLGALRERGIAHPVRVGVPGPAGVAVLARYAALCGVSACASMWASYGLSLGRLLGTAGPDHFVDRLAAGLTAAHGDVQLHFFPFGGVAQSVEWIGRYRARSGTAP